MYKIKIRLPYLHEDLDETALLEALEKIFFGKDSIYMLPMCYDIVKAFMEELSKDIKRRK